MYLPVAQGVCLSNTFNDQIFVLSYSSTDFLRNPDGFKIPILRQALMILWSGPWSENK